MPTRIEFKVEGLDDVIQALDPKDHKSRLIRAANRIANMVKGSLQLVTPKKSGFLASQYDTEVSIRGNDVIARVFNPTLYGQFVNLGTGVFVGRGLIRPRSSRVLRFEDSGEIIFRRFVRGQRPQQFVDRGVNNVRSRILGTVREELGRN